jgi:hypothetical protein
MLFIITIGGILVLFIYNNGPGINPRWCHLGFFPWFLPTKLCALRSIQLLKMSTRDFFWGKGGRCIWLTTLVVPKVEKIRGLNLSGTPGATSTCRGRPLIYFYIYNKTSIKRNILTIKQHREVGRAKDLSAPLYMDGSAIYYYFTRHDIAFFLNIFNVMFYNSVFS